MSADEIERLQVEVHRLREWIRSTGDQYDICTHSVLKEVCNGCRCKREKGWEMILATSSGWLISVYKLSETDHTVTIQERHEDTLPYTISKNDHDQKLFDDLSCALAWIDNHPTLKKNQPC